MKLMTSKQEVETPEPGRRERQRLEREARVAEAMDAANRRSLKSRGVSLAQRVKDAQKELDRPLARAFELLTDLSDKERDIYVLAETLGKNRKGVLNGRAPTAAILAAYELEVGPETPSAT